MRIIDLGASPGGWTQVAVGSAGPKGTVVAVDVLEMEPIAGSVFVHGDCRDPDVMADVRARLPDHAADLVMSDMAPNITGVRATDQAACEDLAHMSLAFAREFLTPGGAFVLKLFQFSDTDALFDDIKRVFRQTWRRKPPASRSESREFYVVAKGYGI